MEMLKIIAVFVLGAVAFGLVHDQITARICVEYFTIAHERIISSESPTILGLVWGVVATWWAGALVGILVALAAREGPAPQLAARDFFRPALFLASLMGVSALLAGVAGYFLEMRGHWMVVEYADAIAPHRYPRFMADVFAHLASYGVGAIGGLSIAARTLAVRFRLHRGGRTGAVGRPSPIDAPRERIPPPGTSHLR
jgi:hypothetical protein